jgi:hypothetical protein
MPFDIVDAVQAQLTSAEVRSISAATNESPDKVRAAMSTCVLATVASVIHRGSSTTGAANVLQTLRTPVFGGPSNLSASFLGDRGNRVIDHLKKVHGIAGHAARSILAVVLPVTASVMSREVSRLNLDAGGFFEFLRTQRRWLLARPELGSLTTVFGLRQPASEAEDEIEMTKDVAPPRVSEKEAALEHEPIAKDGYVRAQPHAWVPIVVGVGALAAAAIAVGSHFVGMRPGVPSVAAAKQYVPAPPVLNPVAPEEPTSQTTTTSAEIDEDAPSEHCGTDVPERTSERAPPREPGR